MRIPCDIRSNQSTHTCENRGIISGGNRNYRGMYREWLKNMVESAPRGTKTRLAEHLGTTGDVVSKLLSGVRNITAEELQQIAVFFQTMPPGFESVNPNAGAIVSEDQVLATLQRIEGVDDRAIEMAMMAITLARKSAKERKSSQPSVDDQSEKPTRHHEAQSSQR